MTDIDNINALIKRIRMRLGLTQQEFAQKMGVEQGFISELERGKYQPTKTFLYLLKYQFQIKSSWLESGGEGEMFAAEPVGSYKGEDSRVHTVLQKVRDIYARGTEDQKATLYGHIGHIYDAIIMDTGGVGDSGKDSEGRFRKKTEKKAFRKPA